MKATAQGNFQPGRSHLPGKEAPVSIRFLMESAQTDFFGVFFLGRKGADSCRFQSFKPFFNHAWIDPYRGFLSRLPEHLRMDTWTWKDPAPHKAATALDPIKSYSQHPAKGETTAASGQNSPTVQTSSFSLPNTAFLNASSTHSNHSGPKVHLVNSQNFPF